MKIIAQIDSNNVLIQATKNEVANVLGYCYESQMPKPEGYREEKIAVGMEIPVSEMYAACQSVKNVAEEIASAIKTHQKLITNLEKFCAVIQPASEVIKSKEPKR